jgi:hypothetical protein
VVKFNWERDRGSLLLLFLSLFLIAGGFVLYVTGTSRIAGFLLLLAAMFVTMAANVRRLVRASRDR